MRGMFKSGEKDTNLTVLRVVVSTSLFIYNKSVRHMGHSLLSLCDVGDTVYARTDACAQRSMHDPWCMKNLQIDDLF